MTEFNTLLLVQDKWDLCIDSAGNIAMAAPPYALAQDVAGAIRLFAGELWYDTTQGIPYWTEVLGYLPPISLLKQLIVNAALTVPGVVQAQCIISSFSTATREMSGQVIFVDENNEAQSVNF